MATLRQLGVDCRRLSAPCNRRDLCARGAGSVSQFTGHWEGHDGSVCSLTVDKAGQCLEEQKIAKSPRKFKKDTSTVVERDRIVAEAEELKSQGRACATSSVSMRLKGLQIPFGEKPQKTRGAKHEDLQRQFSKLCAVCRLR